MGDFGLGVDGGPLTGDEVEEEAEEGEGGKGADGGGEGEGEEEGGSDADENDRCVLPCLGGAVLCGLGVWRLELFAARRARRGWGGGKTKGSDGVRPPRIGFMSHFLSSLTPTTVSTGPRPGCHRAIWRETFGEEMPAEVAAESWIDMSAVRDKEMREEFVSTVPYSCTVPW